MTPGETAIALGMGVALVVPYLYLARKSRDAMRLFAAGLIGAALVYVGFAVAHGSVRDVLVELAGVAVFGILAFLGIRRSSYVLAAGWVIHVGWDVLLHPPGAVSYAPSWYPVACIVFDLVVAGAVIATRRTLSSRA